MAVTRTESRSREDIPEDYQRGTPPELQLSCDSKAANDGPVMSAGIVLGSLL
jgi:hypothetical protein